MAADGIDHAGLDREADGVAAWAERRLAAGESAPTRDPRSVRDGGVVELREVTRDLVRPVCILQVGPDQRGFVAPNAVSLAEAMFEPKAWFRAVFADDIPVGFVMVWVDLDEPKFYLWRFMIDARYQGRGYGRVAIQQVIAAMRERGASELLVSYVPAPGGPEPFYRGLGFAPTGEVEEGEVVARLVL